MSLYGLMRLVIVYRDAEEADLALLLEILDSLQPVSLADPLVVPDVELLDVYGVEPEVFQASLSALSHMIRRKGLVRVQPGGSWPLPVFRGYLRCYVDRLFPLPDYLAN